MSVSKLLITKVGSIGALECQSKPDVPWLWAPHQYNLIWCGKNLLLAAPTCHLTSKEITVAHPGVFLASSIQAERIYLWTQMMLFWDCLRKCPGSPQASVDSRIGKMGGTLPTRQKSQFPHRPRIALSCPCVQTALTSPLPWAQGTATSKDILGSKLFVESSKEKSSMKKIINRSHQEL